MTLPQRRILLDCGIQGLCKMSRGDFDIMKHIGSIVIVGVTILICFFCLVLQLCKKLTRVREDGTEDEEMRTEVKMSAAPDQEPSIGWNTSVMDSKEEYPSTQFPAGFSPVPEVDEYTPQSSRQSDRQSDRELDRDRQSRSKGGRERQQLGFKDDVVYGSRREVGWSHGT